MPDIMMCDGTNCKDKKNCHRYTTTPEIYQTYISNNPNKDFDKETCQYYINNKYKGIKTNEQREFDKNKRIFGRYV